MVGSPDVSTALQVAADGWSMGWTAAPQWLAGWQNVTHANCPQSLLWLRAVWTALALQWLAQQPADRVLHWLTHLADRSLYWPTNPSLWARAWFPPLHSPGTVCWAGWQAHSCLQSVLTSFPSIPGLITCSYFMVASSNLVAGGLIAHSLLTVASHISNDLGYIVFSGRASCHVILTVSNRTDSVGTAGDVTITTDISNVTLM